MKNLFLFITLAMLLASCEAAKKCTLVGKYDDISVIQSTRPVDTVWSNIIDLFAVKGLSIKVIDRSSGLIVSERTSFIKNYTFEKDSRPDNNTAYIVLANILFNGYHQKPSIVRAEWNIRIKPRGTGSTINVNMTNIEAELHNPSAHYASAKDFVFEAKSTGVFEKTIADLVK